MNDEQADDKKAELTRATPIDRDRREFLVNLDIYEGNPTLGNFLDAFERSMGKQSFMLDLVRSVRKSALSCWRPRDLQRFQNLLARLNFNNSPTLNAAPASIDESGKKAISDAGPADTGRPADQTSQMAAEASGYRLMGHEEFEVTLQEIREAGAELEEFMQSLLDRKSRYFVFIPALEIEQTLTNDFNDGDDPAKKIADYTRAAFSRPSTSEPASNLVSVVADGATCLCLAELIQAISQAASTNHPESSNPVISALGSGLYYSLMYLMKVPSITEEQDQTDEPEDQGNDLEWSSHDTWLTKALAYSFDLTQDLFDCVLAHQFRFSTHCANSPVVFHLLCQFPFEVPYRTAGEFSIGVDQVNTAEKMVDGGWKPKAHKLPVIRWRQSHYLFNEFGSIHDEVGNYFRGLGYKQLMEKYSNYRKLNGGYSPLNIDDAARLCTDVRRHDIDVKDPLLAIASLYHHSFSRTDRGLGCHWLLDDSDHAAPDDLAFRAAHYIAIAEQAFADGMDEFGSAILGFFLYSQSLFAEDGIYADLSRLSPLIAHSLKSPGQHVLEQCLSLSVNRLSQSKASLEAKVFSSFLRPRPTLVSINHAPERVIPMSPEKAIVRSSLRTKLPVVFERFSNEAIELLLDAELMWAKLSSEFGSGLGDWGTMGVALTKPVEVELVTRLEHVYKSDNYKQFHRDSFRKEVSTKATLGAIVHMLKAHNNLPATVKESIIQAGVKLPVDLKLLRAMEKALSYRNQGAHANAFSEEDYLKLRKALFSEGGLMSIAEAFTPTGEMFN